MLMVILNHVADKFIVNHSPSLSVYFFEGISHCAVPCFLMLSGAFLIDKVCKEKVHEFYVKSLKKLGIPTLFFIVIYWWIDCLHGMSFYQLLRTLSTGFLGAYAHWYVVMLIGVYALIPFISIIKQNLTIKKWRTFALLFFLWTVMSRWMDSIGATWGTSNVINCLGYVLLGDVIKNLKWKKNNIQGISLFLVGLCVLILNHSLLYITVTNGGKFYNSFLNLYGAPLIVIASIIIFIGFTKMNIKYEFVSALAKYSFSIFLAHKLILNYIHSRFFMYFEKDLSLEIFILLEMFSLFAITFFAIFLFCQVKNFAINKFMNI